MEGTWDKLTKSGLSNVQVSYIQRNGLVVFGIATSDQRVGAHNSQGDTQESHRSGYNDLLLVYDPERNAWDASWDGPRFNILRDTFDQNGINRIFAGDNFGFIYRLDRESEFNDGTRNFTTDLSGTASATSEGS